MQQRLDTKQFVSGIYMNVPTSYSKQYVNINSFDYLRFSLSFITHKHTHTYAQIYQLSAMINVAAFVVIQVHTAMIIACEKIGAV